MAGFAPAGTVTQTGVVIHLHGCPGSCAGVTRHAGHGTSREQLALRNVIGRSAGGCSAVMTTGTVGRCRERAVIGFGTQPGGGGFMAGLATCSRQDMVAGLAGRNSTVMATCTPRNHRDINVEFSRRPTGVALVTGAAVDRGRDVTGRLTGRAAAVVAA